MTAVMPDGWGAGGWRLDATAEGGGWLLLPAGVADVDAWVAEQGDLVRDGWGERWDDAHARPVADLLRAGLAARPEDAALAFQLWPVPAPLVTHAFVAFGTAPDGFVLDTASGVPYDADRLGVGIQRTSSVDAGDVELVGLDILFVAGDVLVHASLQPTIPELFALVAGSFHAFVQTLTLVGPDGDERVASLPPGVAAEERWPDTVPSS
ncbi:hypothetical protein [Microbacterium sp. cf332]|uniref:hypothetical protein n=1 Tax=Microbacterium sp. cf332 TaxID=1761804 RepID=UPI0008807D7A|nr:hypothetical protein [Microbacterium sp. cf332]SDQ76609.1 hypothetical protein SAMN04487847_2413 [Microbacterium sp. cf332]